MKNERRWHEFQRVWRFVNSEHPVVLINVSSKHATTPSYRSDTLSGFAHKAITTLRIVRSSVSGPDYGDGGCYAAMTRRAHVGSEPANES